jgi:hypothetical protein
MIRFSATIERFQKMGEKTGWSYIKISPAQANRLKPGNKVSFRIKGRIDNHEFEKLALIPMGKGDFILPINGVIRKAIGKQHGDRIAVTMEADERKLTLSRDLMTCLADDPMALAFFKSLPGSHQSYFSKWIESAKTAQTKTRRILMAVIGLGKKQGFPEMMRANKRK